jgi:hypothetical protein
MDRGSPERTVQFRLHLDDREPDRVHVTVCLTPDADAACVQGVAIELRGRNGEALSARLMLPISGELAGPLALRTEVRARAELPLGARVHGMLWSHGGILEASCPTDPGTTLEAYAYGSRIGLDDPVPARIPEDLTDHERSALYAAYPWMARYRSPVRDDAEGFIEEQPADLAEDIAETYGLSDEDKAFLEELLADDEELGGDWDDAWEDDRDDASA